MLTLYSRQRRRWSILCAICGSLVIPSGDCRSERPADFVTVVSLEDRGPGTLRDALRDGNRRIEFRIGGEINLKSPLEVAVDDVVVDGTSAPHPGVTITGKPLVLTGARNVHLINLRMRNSDDDNLRIIGGCHNILIENCSSTHAGDGAIDITLDYKSMIRPRGVTIRNCLIAATDKAMLVVGTDNLILDSNLYTNNGQRNPQLHDAQNFNMVNNLVRNFVSYGIRVRAGSSGNVVGNSLPVSPLKPNRPDRIFLIDQTGGDCHIYTRGNLGDKRHDPNNLGTSMQPVGKLPSGIRPAVDSEEQLRESVGARPLDDIDSALVKDDPSIEFRPSQSNRD